MSVFAMSVPSRLSGLSGCVRSKNMLAGHGKLIDNGKLGAFVRLVRPTYNSLTYARACACIWGGGVKSALGVVIFPDKPDK